MFYHGLESAGIQIRLIDNKFIKVREDKCLLPNGAQSDFYALEIKNGAMVIAFAPGNQIVLVKQYRYSAGQELIELPAGVMKKDEKHGGCIKREFEEETGFELKEIQSIGTWFTMSGKSNCQVTVFAGKTGEKKQRAFDPLKKISKLS